MVKTNLKKILSFACAAVLSLSLLPSFVFADGDAWDPGTSSLSVSVTDADREAYPELGELKIPIKLYKVAELHNDGSVTPLEAYKNIPGLAEINPYSKAEEIYLVSAALAAAVAPVTDEKTGEIIDAGTEPDYRFEVMNFNGVLTDANKGLYLMTADDVSSARWKYSARPLLVTLPMTPGKVNKAFVWENEVSMFLKLERTTATGNLKVIKKIDGLKTGEDAAFVFHVYITYKTDEGKDTIWYDNVHTINFKSPGEDSFMIRNIPVGAVARVEEVYSGSFDPMSPTLVDNLYIIANETQEARFENARFPYFRRGSSVENIYTYTEEFGYGFSKQIYHYWFEQVE